MWYLERKLEKLTYGRYEIGVLNNTLDEIIAGKPLKLRLIKHKYKDRWFADPFVLDVDDSTIQLLVEELYYPERKGRIARLTIDRATLHIINNTTVLNIDTHLSFPLIRREGEKIYVIPENGQLGKLVRYLYNRDSDTLVPDKDLINLPLADAVILDKNNEQYMFCTVCPDHSGSLLTVFRKEGSEFKLFREYDFVTDKTARMAGDFFVRGDKLYRPCQDCNKRYGEGVIIQEVIMRDGEFDFKTLSRYTSPSKRWNLGLHTLNSYKGVIVTDVLGYTIHPSMTKFCGYSIAALHRIRKAISTGKA